MQRTLCYKQNVHWTQMRKLLLALLPLVALLPSQPGRAQTIACFGDSLTAGYQAPEGQSYPDDLRKDLAQMGYHATVLNFGQSGNTSKDGLSRIDTVLAAKPSIVILELGANDGFAGTPISIIAKNLATMIQTFQKRHMRVLLVDMMMTPNLGPEYLKQFDRNVPAARRDVSSAALALHVEEHLWPKRSS